MASKVYHASLSEALAPTSTVEGVKVYILRSHNSYTYLCSNPKYLSLVTTSCHNKSTGLGVDGFFN